MKPRREKMEMPNISKKEQLSAAFERGYILKALREDYVREHTPVPLLLRSLPAITITLERMQFHLTYLEQQGYIRIWRERDLPTHRTDRISQDDDTMPDTIRLAKLLAKGLQLIEGGIQPDPLIEF